MPGVPSFPASAAFGVDHALQRARERRQLDRLAGLVGRAVRLQPVLLVVGPGLEEVELLLDAARRAEANREAVLGILNRARRHLGKAHRPPVLEHGQRGVKRAWDHRRVEPGAVQRLAARDVPVDVNRFRRPPLADDRRDLALFLRIDEDERFAAKAIEILLEHAANDERRDAGVKGVAALEEDLERCRGRQRMPGRDAGRRAHHRRPQHRRAPLPALAPRTLLRRDRGDGGGESHNDEQRERSGRHDARSLPHAPDGCNGRDILLPAPISAIIRPAS